MARFKPILAAALAALFIVLLILATRGAEREKSCTIEIVNEHRKRVRLSVEIADTPAEHERGLMYRKHLPEGKGMLFVFPEELQLNFWMKNTYIPLSIAYIGKNGKINELYDMKPLDISITYPTHLPALYALEVNRGWFPRHHIGRGCAVTFHGCFRQQNSHIKR